MRRLPVRVRLVAGFVLAMIVVLLGAGAFVFWRVQYALDHRLNQDLSEQSSDLVQATHHQAPATALASLRDEGRRGQLMTADGRVLASGQAITDGAPLISPAVARRAAREPVHTGHGYLFSPRGVHQRILARPVPGGGTAAVAVSSVSLDQRDEALRELLAQLAIANALALALASIVGYRLARAALDPVERYRAQAEQITHGAMNVRLDVPTDRDDEISRLGSTLNAMLDAQERASERQRQFIDDASHELRTPLTTLAAEIEIALRKPRSADEYETTLHRIQHSTAHVIALAESLLTLGGLGSATPDARELAVQDALATAARRARAQFSDHEVQVDIPDPFTVHADAALLDRALGNLVDNAVRYGDGTITITARRLPGAAILSVHDHGAGIPPPFLEHAAERFSQAETSRTSPGTGLGLALVDAIATAHGGQLRICSAGHHQQQPTPNPTLGATACIHPSSGTTVTLLLPLPD